LRPTCWPWNARISSGRKSSATNCQRRKLWLAARLLQGAEIELVPTRSLLEAAARIAIELDHPAYDCLYLALAMETDCRFVTADERLLRKLGQGPRSWFGDRVIGLAEAAGTRDDPTSKE